MIEIDVNLFIDIIEGEQCVLLYTDTTDGLRVVHYLSKDKNRRVIMVFEDEVIPDTTAAMYLFDLGLASVAQVMFPDPKAIKPGELPAEIEQLDEKNTAG